jgi:hypothetical protein
MTDARRRGVTRDEADLAGLVTDLTRSLRDLRTELEPRPRRLRPPTPGELIRFTDRVAIPAAILVLEANVRTLELLQRAIRLTEPVDSDVDRSTVDAVPERVRSASVASLDRLDDALDDLAGAIDGRPTDDEARRLLDETRGLRDEIDERLAASAPEEAADATDAGPAGRGQSASPSEATGGDVPIDVEAELRSIRDDVAGSTDGSDGGEGSDDGEEDAPDDT